MYDLQVASLRTTTIQRWPNLNEQRLRALLKDHRSVGTVLATPHGSSLAPKNTFRYPRGPHCNASSYSVA